MILRSWPVFTDLFTYNGATKTFSGEMSTLHNNGWKLTRAYDDACDVGFTLVSRKTGLEVQFVMDDEVIDPNSLDVQYWIFKGIKGPAGAKELRAIVFNT